MLSKYRKTIAAVVAAVAGWVGLVVFSEPAAISSAEWYAGLVAVLGALGVYAIPNVTAEQPAE